MVKLKDMDNEVDKDKTKNLEGTDAAHAGLAILARLVARCHLQRIRGFETGHDAEHSGHSIKGQSNGKTNG